MDATCVGMLMPGSLGTFPYYKFTTVEEIITAIDKCTLAAIVPIAVYKCRYIVLIYARGVKAKFKIF